MENELPLANWKDRLLYYMGKRRAFRVEGDSMSPTLNDGCVVLVAPAVKPERGELVLAKHPYRSSVKILKRVAAIESNGDLILLGDNATESTDSRTFGAVSKDNLIGKVVCRLPRQKPNNNGA